MNNYGKFIEPRRRGVLLAILHQSAIQGASVPVLASVAQQAGYRAARETIETDLAVMADMGLLTLRDIGTVRMARIEPRGSDVATGQLALPGIERAEEF